MNKARIQMDEYRSLPKGYYHLCTDGWKDGKLFHTDEQYANGMNTMALIKVKYQVRICAFELMRNHMHSILAGTGEQCVRSFQFFRKRINAKLIEDGYPPLPDDYSFKLIPIPDKESMRRHIIYLSRNPYEKGLCIPGGHLWGTCYLAFNQLPKIVSGTMVRDMAARKIWATLSSRTKLPPDWEIHPVLGVLPKSFVETRMVQEMFPSVKDYCTMMIKDYESFARISKSLGEESEWSVAEVRDMAGQIISKDYPGRSLYELSGEEKCLLAARINSDFGADPKTLSKALYVTEHIIIQALRSKDYGVKP